MLGTFSSSAQPIQDAITLFQGEETILPSSWEVPRIFGKDESGYYALAKDHRYFLEHYNNDLISTHTNYLILNTLLRTRTLEAVIYFHGVIYMFTSELKFSKKILYVQTIDKNNLRQLNDERKLMELDHFKGWYTYFHFVLSRKEDRLLIYGQRDAYIQNIQDLFFYMYGKGLKLEWQLDHRIAYEKRSPRESKVKVSDEGNVFIVSLLDDQNPLSLLREFKMRYLLLAVTDTGRTINQYPVEFPNLYIRGLDIEPGKDHDLSCVGFYSPSHAREYIDGLFYFEVNNRENRFENVRFHEIEPFFLNEAMNLKEEKPVEELFRFRVQHLILRDNGDMIMLAENQYDQSFDNYMNIIAASFSPGGDLNWKRVIPKRQSSHPINDMNHCSYAVHAPWYSNEVYLIYNDHPKNGYWPSQEKVYAFFYDGKAVLKSVQIGPSGELSSSILYRKTRKRMKTPLPLAYYDPRDDDMIIPALRYRKVSFYRISF